MRPAAAPFGGVPRGTSDRRAHRHQAVGPGADRVPELAADGGAGPRGPVGLISQEHEHPSPGLHQPEAGLQPLDRWKHGPGLTPPEGTRRQRPRPGRVAVRAVSPSSRRAVVRNARRRLRGSVRVSGASGRSKANGMAGRPPPDPTSTSRAPGGTSRARANAVGQLLLDDGGHRPGARQVDARVPGVEQVGEPEQAGHHRRLEPAVEASGNRLQRRLAARPRLARPSPHRGTARSRCATAPSEPLLEGRNKRALRLPARSADESGRVLPGRTPREPAVPPRPNGTKILVVESHRRLAAGVTAVVGDDFQVEEARDARQALVALGRRRGGDGGGRRRAGGGRSVRAVQDGPGRGGRRRPSCCWPRPTWRRPASGRRTAGWTS